MDGIRIRSTMNPDAKEFIPSNLRQQMERARMQSGYQQDNNCQYPVTAAYNSVDQQQYNIQPGLTSSLASNCNAYVYGDSGPQRVPNVFMPNHYILPQGTKPKKTVLVKELEQFIKIVTPEPSLFDSHVKQLIETAENWLDENESVPNDVVQQILRAALSNKDFRYNGVRLCMHLNNDIKKHGQLFNKALVENCKLWIDFIMEEKNDRQYYTEDLTLFIGDLYSRIPSTDLGIGLLQLIKMLVIRPNDYRMKVSAQILKLCGQSLDQISSSQHLNPNCSLDYIISLMETCVTEHDSISENTRALVQNVIHLKRNDWAIRFNGHNNHVTNSTTHVDDYSNYESSSFENFEYIQDLNGLINDDEENYDQLQQQLEQNDYILQGESVCEFNGEQFIIPSDDPQFNNHAAGYDFGNSDDEQNDDVCNAFEQFLSELPDE